MKKSKFIAAAALFTLASCTVSDEVFTGAENLTQQQQDENVISFGTYVGKTGVTRTGYDQDMTTDRLKTEGFGVFGYYTNASGYFHSAKEDGSTPLTNIGSASKPNFMYNEKVTWNSLLGDSYITKWTYSPIKYWPNEVASGAVDDQENDASNAQATTTNTKGGIVSFFAYAPWVDLSTALTGTGIVGINGTTGLTGTNVGNDKAGDPTVTYKLASSGNNVDLLWGTKGNTSSNVLASTQEQEYVTKDGTNFSDPKLAVNVNLTKQKTNGVVDFLFKHALSKLGGTTVPFSKDNKNGLMVVLDLDDMMGAETGGAIEVSGGKNLTKVMIKSITISNDLNGDGKINDSSLGGNPGKNDEYNNYTGTLNLATGEWTFDPSTAETAASTNVINHVVDNTGTSAKLRSELDDATTATKDAGWFNTSNTTDPGVTTTPQNVYNAEAKPFVLFPSSSPIKLRFSIDYVVRTYDSKLKGNFSEVEQIINKIVTFPTLKMNKYYSILMHLGLTSVKFTATVADWESTTGTDADGDGEIDLIQEDVYLPRNVGGLLVTWSSDKAGSKGATITVSDTKYYVDNVEHALTPATVTSDPTGASISTSTITLPDNTALSDRNIALTISGTDGGVTYTSNTYNVTQYGRVPESAAITWTADPTSTTLTKAGQDITFTSITAVTVDGKESDATGAASATAFSSLDVSSDYALLFVDNATGKKATWISADATKITTLTNGTAANRTATLYIVSANKRIPVKSGGSNVTFTQPGA